VTPEQKELFIWIAQMGIACGLEHPFEWYFNYVRHLPQLVAYPDMPKVETEAMEAFTAFYKDTASHPDDPVKDLTCNGFIDMVNEWYSKGRS
jgi:hypothetical protein